ncbi:MAG TPA: hypothetical protein VI789_08005 [Dehalococcoidia bacterium]|nr:hypothetical protein [Dehalococcoidia bacterium]
MTIRRRVEEVTEDVPRADVEELGYDEVVEKRRGDPWNVARGWVRMIGAWIMAALAVVETLLVFRLGFQLANANPNNGFVDFIYDITGGLVDPFKGIIRNRSVGDGVLEPATLIAMAVYFVAAMLLVAIIWALTSAPSPAGDRSVTTRSHRGTSVH